MFLNASDACPNDIHGHPVSGCDVRNSSNSFTLRWRVFSSEVAKLKWFCFNQALKLALYTKKKARYSHNNCVNQCPVIVIGVLCVILLS